MESGRTISSMAAVNFFSKMVPTIKVLSDMGLQKEKAATYLIMVVFIRARFIITKLVEKEFILTLFSIISTVGNGFKMCLMEWGNKNSRMGLIMRENLLRG